MINLTVIYPLDEKSVSEILIFSAEASGDDLRKKDITNMAAAEEYVEEALSDVFGIVSISTDSDTGDLVVVYDPTESSWKSWYGYGVSAITRYYETAFKQPIDVNHRTVPEKI